MVYIVILFLVVAVDVVVSMFDYVLQLFFCIVCWCVSGCLDL